MLPPEIEPFADHHIAALKEVQNFVQAVRDNSKDLPHEHLDKYLRQLSDAQNALYRFKVCMADEVKQKEQLHQKSLHCRLNHK